MPFSKVHHCVLCEDARLERRRLASLLGFYGILPRVHILISTFNEAPSKFTFGFIGEPLKGSSTLSVRIVDDQNTNIKSTQTITVSLESSQGDTTLFVAMEGIVFKAPGKHWVELIADVRFRNSFDIRQGNPKDFE